MYACSNEFLIENHQKQVKVFIQVIYGKTFKTNFFNSISIKENNSIKNLICETLEK